MLRRWINSNQLRDKIHIVIKVHDEINCVCAPELAETLAQKLQEFMELAAKEVLKNDLLRSEPEISDCWIK